MPIVFPHFVWGPFSCHTKGRVKIVFFLLRETGEVRRVNGKILEAEDNHFFSKVFRSFDGREGHLTTN